MTGSATGVQWVEPMDAPHLLQDTALDPTTKSYSVQTVDGTAIKKPWTSDITLNKLLIFWKLRSPYVHNADNNTTELSLKGG